MVFLFPKSHEESESSVKCALDGCKGSGNMLKCSNESCKNYFHVICAKFSSDEEATQAPYFFCSTKCRPKVKDPSTSSKSSTNDAKMIEQLERKIDAQKTTLNNLATRCKAAQNENEQRQAELTRCLERIKDLETQNKRIQQLEDEISDLKNNSVVFMGNQVKTIEGANAKQECEEVDGKEELEALFQLEDDEEFKRRLTEVFQKKPPEQNSASHVLFNEPASRSTKSDTGSMTETQKLAYYQRLHVQRMDAPKLMKYEGDPAQWLSFKANYDRMREKGEYDNEAMIEKLREALFGEAEKFVRQRLNQPYADADNIMEVIKRKFFQPKEAVAKSLAKLESWHQIPDKNRKELEAFLFELDNYIYLCENLEFKPELEVAINSRITSKLPYNVETRWCTHINEKRTKGTVRELSEFMWTFVQNLPIRPADTTRNDSNVRKFKSPVQVIQNGESSKNFTSKKTRKDKFPLCWYCGNEERHYLSRCENFKKLAYDEKAKFLAANKICSRCLSSTQHASNNCPLAKSMKCSRPNCADALSHCTVMHPPLVNTERSNRAPVRADNNCFQSENGSQTLFKIVPIYVIDGFGRRIETTLLMDRAAGSSLVSRELFDQLKIGGESIKLELTWLQPNATYNNPNALLHDLTIAPKHDPNRLIKLNGMYAINGVSLPEQKQDPKKIKEMHPYLQEADIPAFEAQRPQILLGLPHAKWMVSLETIMDFASDSSPIAEKTPLGWTVCGGLTPQKSIFHVCDTSENECSHNYDHVDEGESLEALHELVKHFNSFEMLGLTDPNKQYICKNDELAIKIQNDTMKRVTNRYEIGLYWINDDCTLPDNYCTALKRLKSTESRLKQLGMIEWANEHHKNLQQLGFARVATEDDLNPDVPHKRINYVIGFVTFNLNKQPPKPRWVVDTASKHNGISLNSVLLKGPDNLIPLTQALFHFRERKYAMVSDVTKMYHQVKIKKEDQQVQRYLWRDCNTAKEPTTFIFESMLFGPTCSPSQANAVRIDHALKSAEKHPGASRVALNSMYMDDAFNSEDSIEEAVKVARETIEMFGEISWDMVSFRSNSNAALRQLPLSNVDDKLLVDLSTDDEIMSRKVLGLVWDVNKDVFMFQMANNQELISLSLYDNYHPTKKEVLSFIMKIFDCLGLISHFHVRGKMILQAIWRQGIGWNQHIPDDIHESWKRWLEKFEEIERLEIPRHYGYDSRCTNEIALHVFVDASTEAYAAVAYFRFVANGTIHVAQVMSKCRVAPVKYSSVPRLELMAALMGARIMNTIKKQHTRMKIQNTTFWTDSVTVLRWLYSHHIRLQQFVAPRVCEIQETSNVNDWRYVPTNENVADDGTKWNDIDFSSPAQRWLKGPDFLYRPEDEWPAKFPVNMERSEESRVLIAVKKNDNNMYYAGIFEEVSPKIRANWKNYRVVVGWILRFCASLIALVKGRNKPNVDKFLSADEIYDAENMIFKQIQKAVFADELINLTRGQGVAQSSKLYSLNPFLDENQMIRARTRMYMDESISYDMKCPPILPNKHETIHAFLVYLHIKNKHIGIETTIAEARSRAWVIYARTAVKRVKHQCLFCIEIRARQQNPELAPLPSYRLDPKSHPFEHCGADCCGPFTIYTGLSRHKREVNVVIFTCMITRAVYLRKLDHMSADEMMLAIQDVWTRRGPIRHMYSDNGRNFLGASNIIKDEHHRQLAAEKQLKWHFSPALTPHWGGVWERLIKDIKRAMKVEMSKRTLPEKVFECVLLQVEDIMNNRPLTHLPVSPDDMAPLTPNYLLKLNPGYSFVGGKAQTDDEDSRYYTRRARLVSEKLMTKWVKEYLPIITRQHKLKKPGYGLKLNDYIIYTDPTIKPAEWQRGIIINVYTGRDGIARVADVKLRNGNILERRSVTRLAKLDIDAESFGEVEISATSKVTEYTDTSCLQSDKIIPAQNNLIENPDKMVVVSAQASDNLTIALGDMEFLTKEQVQTSTSPYADEIRESVARERFEDPDNEFTFKINRIPALYSIHELIIDLTKLNLWVTRVVVDSVTQRTGYFAFVTLDSKTDVDNVLNLGEIEILGRKCKISRTRSACPTLERKQFEYGFVFWNRDASHDQFILLSRKKDSSTTRHAVSCLNDNLWSQYRRLKPVESEDSVSESSSDNDIQEHPTVRSIIVRVPDTMPQSRTTAPTVSNVAVNSISEPANEDQPSTSSKRRRVIFK